MTTVPSSSLDHKDLEKKNHRNRRIFFFNLSFYFYEKMKNFGSWTFGITNEIFQLSCLHIVSSFPLSQHCCLKSASGRVYFHLMLTIPELWEHWVQHGPWTPEQDAFLGASQRCFYCPPLVSLCSYLSLPNLGEWLTFGQHLLSIHSLFLSRICKGTLTTLMQRLGVVRATGNREVLEVTHAHTYTHMCAHSPAQHSEQKNAPEQLATSINLWRAEKHFSRGPS
jgi:hypothetical protein